MSDEEKIEETKAPEATDASEATAEAIETPVVVEETIEEPVPETAVEETVVDEKLPGTEIRISEVKPGMTIRVHERIKDVNAKGEERERIQIFQGMVIGIRGANVSKTMTLRRQHKGYGAEKIYPLDSPVISKVELVKTAKVRRAKLSYLQNLRNRFKRKLKEDWAVAEK